MAELGGYKTAASANTAFAVLRRKLIGDYQQWAGRATRGKGKPVLVVEDSEDDDEEAEAGEPGEPAEEGEEEATAVPVKKAPVTRKRKAGTTTEGADANDAEGEETEAEGPIKKKLKSMKVGGAVEGEKENDEVVEAADAEEDEEAEDADNENEE